MEVESKPTKKLTKCVWNMGDECEGEVTNEDIFENQIKVPICENHFTQHKEVMFLHSKGEDIDELMQMSREERRELFEKVRAKFPDEELPV